ncbi:MAG TPA: carbohydrate-binding protein [Pseudonocardiaceae bacterium]|mgnify:CR=1 FL=1
MLSRLTTPAGRRRARVAAAAAAMALAASVSAAWQAGASVPPPPSGWNLVWYDDFDGPANALPSSANWIIDIGTSYPGGPPNWGTGERQTYTDDPANVSLDGAGNLRITPRRDAAGNWTSARIETVRSDFKPPAGGVLRIEGRIQMPNITGAGAAGYWPAFWALGSPYRGNYQNWPGIGEFDIMENVNGLNQVWGVVHCGVAPGGPCGEFDGLGNSRACPGSPCQSDFHTYAFEWDTSVTPNELRWYVDGQHYHTVTQDRIGEPYWSQMTSHAGYFLLLNVAMGGSFPDGVAGGQTPTAATVPDVPMLVDYVAVYTRGGSSEEPPGDTISAYGQIEAESYHGQQGVQVENSSSASGGASIGWLANGDWVRYDGVDFGSTPPHTFVARAASGAPEGVSGLVEVRLDSLNNPPIGSFAIANTGGWQSWREVPAQVSSVTGTHTVYLTFTSGQPADFVNIDWFTFRR